MNKILLCFLVSLVTLSGCSPQTSNETAGTFVGATAGGALGSMLFHGDSRFPGAVLMGTIGGLIGNRIGNRMDANDRHMMYNAISGAPGRTVSWKNYSTKTSYNVTPTKVYNRGYCREFQTVITVAGKREKAYGKACKTPNGDWEIVG